MKVKEIMSSKVITIQADKPVSELAGLFAQPNVGGMPVVDENDNIIGLVTMVDFIEFFLPHSPLIIQELISTEENENMERDILSVDLRGTKIEDIMEKRVVTIAEEDSLIKAATLFYQHKIRTLPVVNSGGKLVGIVTLSDVCKGVSESLRRLKRVESRE